MKGKSLYIIIVALLVISCQRALIKPDGESGPERNFEIFWNDVHNGYPYFKEDKIDWRERYNKYRPLVSSSTTDSKLFEYMSEMLSGFSDGHLTVKYQGQVHSNEKTIPNIIDLVRGNSSGSRVSSPDPIIYYLNHFRTISKKYVDATSYTVVTASNGLASPTTDTVCIYGYINSDKIIYINIASFLTTYAFDELIRKIITQYPDSKVMILDLIMI